MPRIHGGEYANGTSLSYCFIVELRSFFLLLFAIQFIEYVVIGHFCPYPTHKPNLINCTPSKIEKNLLRSPIHYRVEVSISAFSLCPRPSIPLSEQEK